MKPEVYFYKGYIIQKVRAGDGYNIYGSYTIPFNTGLSSVEQAKNDIDSHLAGRENKLPTSMYRINNCK